MMQPHASDPRGARTGRGRRRARGGAASILVAILLLACHPATTANRPPDIVLIVVDTLRADRLGYAGHEAARTKHFDALQRESVWFPHAYTTSSWTIPAMGSLMLSRLPSEHGMVKWGSKLSPDETTVVERLSQAGYRTGAWTANRLMGRGRGFAQGFDRYQMVLHPKKTPDTKPGTEYAIAPAAEVTRRALAFIEEQKRVAPDVPLFTYVHYLEPHTPYLCEDESEGAPCRGEAADLSERLLFGDWTFEEGEAKRIRELYDVEVARMDEALGVLLDGLRAQGSMDDAWLILVADHGESLGEAGAWVHGLTLGEPVVRIPLLVRPPGGRGAVVETPVSLLDVAPTLLEIAGVEVPKTLEGRSLLGAVRGEPLEPRRIWLELYAKSSDPVRKLRHVRGVVDGRSKWLVTPEGDVRGFDLASDPGEVRPREASPEDLATLRAAGLVAEPPPALVPGAEDVEPEMADHLKALGYIH